MANDDRRRTSIRIERSFRASPDRVFDAWLDADTAGAWLFATASRPMSVVRIDARVSGRFSFAEERARASIEHSGEYLEIDPHRRLVFALDGATNPTRVVVEVSARRRGCRLTLTHEQVSTAAASGVRARWRGILYGLDEHLADASG